MSEAKFAAAHQLIQEKHYDAARAILRTMDEPRAHEWLTKLQKFPQAQPRRQNTIAWAITAIALVIATGSFLLWFTDTQPPQDNLNQAIKAFCGTYGLTQERCDETIARHSEQDITDCFNASSDGKYIDVFTRCMVMKSISIQIDNTTAATPDYSSIGGNHFIIPVPPTRAP